MSPNRDAGVTLETVLLLVGAAEEPEAAGEQQDERGGGDGRQRFRCVDQPPAGEAVKKWHQHIVSPNQHPSQALADHVPGVRHSVFELEVVEHVQEGEDLIERHCQGQPTIGFVLHDRKGCVEQRQGDEGRAVAEKLQSTPSQVGLGSTPKKKSRQIPGDASWARAPR